MSESEASEPLSLRADPPRRRTGYAYPLPHYVEIYDTKLRGINVWIATGRRAGEMPPLDDPQAISEIIDRWLQSVEAAPDFCRQVSLIFFTRSRHIFYDFRDRELKGMHKFLQSQQKCGTLRADANLRDLAEQLVLLASGLCLEWSDRPFPIAQLRRRLYSGYANLLAAAVAPDVLARRAGR